MRLRHTSIVALLVLAPAAVGAFTAPTRHRQSRRPIGGLVLRSSNDAAFAAFADSLEEDSEAAPTTATATADDKAQTWQTKLDGLLSPTTNAAERQVLLSDLLKSDEAIRESVMDAVSRRQLEPLLTPTGKRLQDGTRAVARQLANDILPNIRRNGPAAVPLPPPPLEKVGTRLFNAFSNQVQKNLGYLQEDLSDPFNKIPKRISAQTETLAQEAKNVFLETPEGLTEPEYAVIRCLDSYEIRDYASYKVAETAMGNGADDLASSGKAFNSLAAYLFGANEDQKSMAMTTPVSTTSAGEMRFYLSDSNVPEPLDKSNVPVDSESGTIRLVDIPAARLAVRKFTGFVTDGEVARQKEALLQALEVDGVELDVPHGSVVPHIIFQYNPPYTLPIVRRNEIAVPVRGRLDEIDGETDIRQEWDIVPASDAADEIVEEAITSSLEGEILTAQSDGIEKAP